MDTPGIRDYLSWYVILEEGGGGGQVYSKRLWERVQTIIGGQVANAMQWNYSLGQWGAGWGNKKKASSALCANIKSLLFVPTRGSSS